MTLGAIIGRLRDKAFVDQTIADLDDIVLLTRLQAAAAAAGDTLSDIATGLVGRFVQYATDEAWLSLITSAMRSSDPAATSLRCMLSTALTLEVPSHHCQAPQTTPS
jgi:hypothetical protein